MDSTSIANSLGVALLVASLFGAGCKGAQPFPTHENVTAEQAQAHGELLARALAAPCDEAQLRRLVDHEALFMRAAAGIDAPRRVIAAMATGFGRVLGETLCRDMGQTSKVRVLRTRSVDGEARVLLRVLVDGGLNYVDLSVGRRDGQIRTLDYYTYATGQPISELFAPVIRSMVKHALKQPFGPTVKQMTRLSSLVKQGKNKEARAVIATLPPELRDSKAVRLRDVFLASELTDEEYLAALNDFGQRYPDDPAHDLLLLARHVLRDEFGKALKVVDRLDKAVGGDPYLAVQRAHLYRLSGDVEKAKHQHSAALKEEPTLVDAHWGLVEIALSDNAFKVVADHLLTIRDTLKEDVSRWRSDEGFAAFRGSSQAARLKN